jgi:hypothetical protein
MAHFGAGVLICVSGSVPNFYIAPKAQNPVTHINVIDLVLTVITPIINRRFK